MIRLVGYSDIALRPGRTFPCFRVKIIGAQKFDQSDQPLCLWLCLLTAPVRTELRGPMPRRGHHSFIPSLSTNPGVPSSPSPTLLYPSVRKKLLRLLMYNIGRGPVHPSYSRDFQLLISFIHSSSQPFDTRLLSTDQTALRSAPLQVWEHSVNRKGWAMLSKTFIQCICLCTYHLPPPFSTTRSSVPQR